MPVACACNACVQTHPTLPTPPHPCQKKDKKTQEKHRQRTSLEFHVNGSEKEKRTCIRIVTVKLTRARRRRSLRDDFYVPRQSFPFISSIKNMFLTIKAEKHPQLVKGLPLEAKAFLRRVFSLFLKAQQRRRNVGEPRRSQCVSQYSLLACALTHGSVAHKQERRCRAFEKQMHRLANFKNKEQRVFLKLIL